MDSRICRKKRLTRAYIIWEADWRSIGQSNDSPCLLAYEDSRSRVGDPKSISKIKKPFESSTGNITQLDRRSTEFSPPAGTKSLFEQSDQIWNTSIDTYSRSINLGFSFSI